jgi:uncharacterized protein (TIGR02145 family)
MKTANFVAGIAMRPLVLLFFLLACSDDNSENDGAAKDQDGNTFKTVRIGNQVWSAENLNVGTFRNGDPITEIRTEEEWENAANNDTPVWSYYDNDPANGEKYGRLYNWHVVNDPRGLAPSGWHVATDAEWTTLANTLGGADIAGFKMKAVEWNGDNSSGFNALPAGFRNWYFTGIGEDATWWTSTPASENAYLRSLSPDDEVVRSYFGLGTCFSVRLVKD